MCKTAYYVYNLSTNAHNDIYSTNNARKILEGKPALAIPMRALKFTRITVQKQVRLHETSAPMVRKQSIPLRALILYLDPSLQTYVCPFLIEENEIFIFCEFFFFCQFANWKKICPWQCAHSNQNYQNGSFWQIAHMGTLKKCAYGYHNARINLVRI